MPIRGRLSSQAPEAGPSRTRQRPFQTAAVPPLNHPIAPSQDVTRPSIARIKLAFQDTPEKLRLLEHGWRQKRRTRRLVTQHGMPREQSEADRFGGKKDTTPALPSHDGAVNLVVHPEHQTRGIQVKVPPTPPPSPPPSAPHKPPVTGASSPSRPAWVLGHGRQSPSAHKSLMSQNNEQPQPILAHPLSPTHRHVPLTRDATSKIHVHPLSSPYELSIQLSSGSALVDVLRGGMVIILGVHRPTRLNLANCHDWTREEKRTWIKVQTLVVAYKRRMPRVKLYHALGHLSITCSFPPDIMLSFVQQHTADTTAFTENVRTLALRPTKLPAEYPIKVQVTYSRVAHELRLDASSHQPAKPAYPNEVFRSRRTISLPTTGDAVNHGQQEKTLDALLAESSSGWRHEEKEGLRRLVELRPEWSRYDFP